MTTRRILKFSALFIAAALAFSCNKKNATPPISDVEFSEAQNEIKQHMDLGKDYRNNSQFEEAIIEHSAAFDAAERIRDTINMVIALNQIGTDHRRLGALDEASTWHYRAIDLCTEYSDSTSFQAKKNKVTALNGIGNIFLSIGNNDAAEEIFLKALRGEEELGSDLGQAINCANIASIIEERGDLEEALKWQNRAMEHNRKANSTLGIGLCHCNYGRLAYKRGDETTAVNEYLNAYDILKETDKWHWLEPCFQLARYAINHENWSEAYGYISEGLDVAKSINSLEHIAQGYELMSIYYENRHDWFNAMNCYKLSIEANKQITNESSTTKILNDRINYHAALHNQEMEKANHEKDKQEARARLSLILALIIGLSSIIVITSLAFAIHSKSKAEAALKHLEHSRREFFTNITHELRTPLTIIIGMSQKLKAKYGKDEMAKADFDAVIGQSNSLLELVNQLLDIAKVRSSIGEAEWKHGDLDMTIRMHMEFYKEYGAQSNVEVSYTSNAPQLEIDFVPDYTRKVVANLVSNAIKFTPRGGHVDVTLNENGKYAVISVVDNGPGIPPDELPHIFEYFYKGETSKLIPGTGIGLSMVKQMVDAMDGKIEVNSQLHKGTCFKVFIPIKHGDEELAFWNPEEAKFTEEIPQLGQGTEHENAQTILIVEDNDYIASFEGRILGDKYKLIYARDGEEGLKKAHEYMPDIIVTDLMMPIMDGYELTRKIRSSIEINHIPIIIVSAKITEEDRIEGLKAGADQFITKPFNPDELLIIVDNALNSVQATREKYRIAHKEGIEETVDIPEKNKEFLAALNSFINSKMADPDLNSDMIASALCISQRQLNRKVKSVTNTDTTTYIRQARMATARKLLLTTSLSIGDIVGRCGFDSASYFSKLYKQEYGETPTQTRKGAL